MKRYLFFIPGIGLLLQAQVPALIVAGGTGAFNTTNPNPASPASGWNHVAWNANQASSVYLGGGWVLTAAHVGANTISFAGDPNLGATPTYSVVPGSAVTLTNNGAMGQTANTDLVLFQINGEPGLPSLSISSVSPAAGTFMTQIATGRDRVSALTTWDVDTVPNPDVWLETPPNPDLPGNPNATGFLWDSTRTKRWGTNNTIAASAFEDVGSPGTPVNVRAFRSNFSNAGVNETQSATGDSGSGVFILNGGVWELAGITLAIGGFSGQPAETAVFGNETYYADLSFYRNQILSIIPEPGSLALGGMVLIGLLRRRRA